ncbi:MAG TPA: choice-of-anchor tandem repeat NxxGxxAF-containing protein [Lacipirellulaceae bacterium]|nr:choice-of-anchor tandem repeat NxxGxxAF-containing protein [Lacipirellulaceae bacterium]
MSKLHFATCFVVWSCGAAAASAAGPYAFTNIADTTSTYSEFYPSRAGRTPSINNHGEVAFWAVLLDGTEAIRRRSGNQIDTIADNSGMLSTIGSPSISDNGVVVFAATADDGRAGVFAGSGGPVTTIADSAGPLDSFGSSSDINAAGNVAYSASLDTTGYAAFVSNGGGATTVADTTGPLATIDSPRLNDSGAAAFWAFQDGGFANDSIHFYQGGALTTIADQSGPFSGFGNRPGITNDGTVVFSATFDTGGMGIFKSQSGVVTPVVDTTGPFIGFRFLAANNHGQVAFIGSLDSGGEGIFVGPDPTADKVILAGDALFGSTLTSIETSHALNDRGQIAFYYRLANGVSGIAVASPIPEPSTIVLIAAVGLILGTPKPARR